MKFLAFLTNLLLASVITATVLLMVIDHTTTASYVTSVAERTNAYTELSKLLPVRLTQGDSDKSGGAIQNPAEQQQMVATLTGVLTPDYLKTQITSAASQFEDMFKHDAPQVVIDLSAISDAARKAGADTGDDQFEPIVLTAEKFQKPIMIVGWAETARVVGLIASVVLLLLAIWVGYARRTYHSLGRSLLSVAISEILVVIGLLLAPSRLVANAHFDTSVVPFTPLITAIVNQVANDWMWQFGAVGVVALVLAIILMLFGKHLPMRPQTFVAHPSAEANQADARPTTPPETFS